jgi:hypothetical protein
MIPATTKTPNPYSNKDNSMKEKESYHDTHTYV